jgi:hypothetical protein
VATDGGAGSQQAFGFLVVNESGGKDVGSGIW